MVGVCDVVGGKAAIGARGCRWWMLGVIESEMVGGKTDIGAGSFR